MKGQVRKLTNVVFFCMCSGVNPNGEMRKKQVLCSLVCKHFTFLKHVQKDGSCYVEVNMKSKPSLVYIPGHFVYNSLGMLFKGIFLFVLFCFIGLNQSKYSVLYHLNNY